MSYCPDWWPKQPEQFMGILEMCQIVHTDYLCGCHSQIKVDEIVRALEWSVENWKGSNVTSSKLYDEAVLNLIKCTLSGREKERACSCCGAKDNN